MLALQLKVEKVAHTDLTNLIVPLKKLGWGDSGVA